LTTLIDIIREASQTGVDALDLVLCGLPLIVSGENIE
jgi:hypothetical protein